MLVGIKNWFFKEGRQLASWWLIVWLLFGYSLFFDFFIFDDYLHFYDNKHVGVQGLSDLFYFWKTSLTPVIFFCWQIISIFFGNDSPVAFRIFNFFLLGGISYLLCRSLTEVVNKFEGNGKNYYRYLPFFATAIYLLHPAQIESVIWPSSGRTLLATFFALLSLRMFQISLVKVDEKIYGFLVVIFYALGLLSKPSIVMLPFLFISIQNIEGKKLKDSFLHVLPLFLVGILLGLLHSIDTLSPHLTHLGFKTRLLIFLDSIIFYLKMVFLPLDVLFNYGRNPERILLDFSQNKAGFLLVPITFSIFVAAGFFTRGMRRVSYFLFLFFLLLMPNMGLLHYDFQNISTVANRYLNFPLVALCLGLCYAGKFILDTWKSRIQMVQAISGILLVLLVFSSFKTGSSWRSSDQVLLKGNSDQYFANAMSLGFFYNRTGQFTKSEENFYKAWNIDPNALEPAVGLIGLYEKYSFTGNIQVFLNRLEEKKIIVPANKAYLLAKLYFQSGSYHQARNYSRISFQANLMAEEARALFSKSEQELNNKKENAYLEIIGILLKENRVKDAYNFALDAKKEIPNSQEIGALINEVFSKLGKK